MTLGDRFLKSLLKLTLVSVLLIGGSTTVSAEEGPGSFSANVGIFSEYSFRGIDQSGEEPAIQGGFDWAHDSGFYLGTWASNVDFNDNDSVSEFDFYGGYATELKNGLNIDLSAIGYTYPGALNSSDYDFIEYALGLGKSIGPVSLSSAINWSGQFFGGSGDATYIQGGIDYTLPQGITLSGHVGKQWIEHETTYGAPDYVDYSVSGSYTLQSFDLSVTYVDTDVDDNWNSTDQSGKEGRTIFGVSRSF
jgi:uncharacterized protein (TIGR02001 family)